MFYWNKVRLLEGRGLKNIYQYFSLDFSVPKYCSSKVNIQINRAMRLVSKTPYASPPSGLPGLQAVLPEYSAKEYLVRRVHENNSSYQTTTIVSLPCHKKILKVHRQALCITAFVLIQSGIGFL